MKPLVGAVGCRILVSVCLMGWLIFRIDMEEALGAAASMDVGHLMAAFGVIGIDRGLMIWRWVILVRHSEPGISVKSAVWVFLVGSYVGSLLPSGVGGDAAKAYVLAGRMKNGVDAIALVAIDRWLGLCSLAFLAAVGILAWGSEGGRDLEGVSAALAVLAAGGTIGLFWAGGLFERVIGAVGLERTGTASALRIGKVIGRYRKVTLVSGLFGLSLMVQLARVLQAYVLGRGLGIEVELSYYLAFMPVGILAIMLPISIGGFGPAQGVIVWLLRPAGVADAQSFALSTLFLLTGLVAVMPGALVHLRGQIVRRRSEMA